MKRNIARHILFARLAALALLTLCFVQPPVGARATEAVATPMPLLASDHRDGPIFDSLGGIWFGQTLRLTAALVSRAEQNQPPPDFRVKALLYDAQGRVIAQSAEVRVPRNEFRFFDFNRAAINLPGEAGTGRLQVRAQLVAHVEEPYHLTDDPKATYSILPSMEIIDNNTGRTRLVYNPFITVDFVESGTGGTAASCSYCTNNLKQIGLALHHSDSQH